MSGPLRGGIFLTHTVYADDIKHTTSSQISNGGAENVVVM